MTNKRKFEICESILQSYDKTVWPDVSLSLVEHKRQSSALPGSESVSMPSWLPELYIRGLPFQRNQVWFNDYDDFCFGLGGHVSFLEWSKTVLDWSKTVLTGSDFDLFKDFYDAYAITRNVVRNASSWEELELRLSIGGFLTK